MDFKKNINGFSTGNQESKNKTHLKNKKIISETNIDNYQDTSGISTKKLELGLWFVENKKFFKRVLIIFLLVISIFSWGYTVYGFGYYIFKGMLEDERLAREIAELEIIDHGYIKEAAAKDLFISKVKIFKANANKYDFLVKVKNLNKRHWGEFDYCFLENINELDCGKGFIMPGEEKYSLSLANDFADRPDLVEFVLKNISWKKINRHAIPDWQSYQDEKLNFKIKDKGFKSANSSGLSEKLNLNSLQFIALNKSPYNYWNVGFVIILSRNDQVAWINRYTAEEFMSGEERLIEINWPGSLIRVDKIEIIPEINIMDDSVFIKYDGGIGEKK